MIKFTFTRNKLFAVFSLLGILNIILAYSFFYYSSIELLEQRSTQQMASSRALASQKLSLYFDNLKYISKQKADELIITRQTDNEVLNTALTGIYFLAHDDTVTVLKGGPISSSYLRMLKEPMKFYPLSTDGLMLLVPHRQGNLVLTFDFQGVNKLLMEYEGMGKSGEIYLVGTDNIIRSASRHRNSANHVLVDNASVQLGKNLTSGVHTVRDYRGVKVLSAYSPFKADHVELILLSEIDKKEVLSPLNALFPQVFVICLFLCLLSVVVAHFLTAKILALAEKKL